MNAVASEHEPSATSEVMSRLAVLESRLEEVESARDQFRRLYLDSLETIRKLEKGLLGQKAERLPTNEHQLTMDILGELLGRQDEDAPAPSTTIEQHERRKPTGRKPLPEDLPRVDIEVLPPEVEREGTDAFHRIGEEVSEVVERRPASVVVVRVVRPKFVPKAKDAEPSVAVLTAEPPELPIPKGLAGPGMLADSIVRRWQDNLPAHRLEGIYARDGLELSRSTICG